MTEVRNSLRANHRAPGRVLTAVGIALFAVSSFGCEKKQEVSKPVPEIPVVVAKVTQRAMPVQITSVGNVEALSSVSIRSQVSGQLMEVHFKEGDFVHKGQLLLTIDSRPYLALVEQAKNTIVRDQAQLAQAEANLAKDSAQEEYARSEAQRYATLLDRGLISKEALEQSRAHPTAWKLTRPPNSPRSESRGGQRSSRPSA